MAKTITLDDLNVDDVHLSKDTAGVLVANINYTLLEQATGNKIARKQEVRFGSTAQVDPSQMLPAAWETEFEGLLADIKAKLIAYEGLDA